MTNKNVIEIIDRLMDSEAEQLVYTASEVFTAIAHGYYFIRPGKNTAKFFEKIDGILEKYWNDRDKMYVKTKHGVPYEEWLWGKMASEALLVMRSMFNKDTYAYQKASMEKDMNDVYSKELLELYLYRLDIDEIKHVFDGILAFKESNDFFISDESYDRMMEEFKERCTIVAEAEADDEVDYNENLEFMNNHPKYFFYYLCRETIVDILYRYVDIDPILLAHMIKAYIYSETSTAAEYTGLAAKLMYGYDLDIFDPIITDVEAVDLDTPAFGNMKKLCTHKMREFKIGTVSR